MDQRIQTVLRRLASLTAAVVCIGLIWSLDEFSGVLLLIVRFVLAGIAAFALIAAFRSRPTRD